jgi:hypothetical protein
MLEGAPIRECARRNVVDDAGNSIAAHVGERIAAASKSPCGPRQIGVQPMISNQRQLVNAIVARINHRRHTITAEVSHWPRCLHGKRRRCVRRCVSQSPRLEEQATPRERAMVVPYRPLSFSQLVNFHANREFTPAGRHSRDREPICLCQQGSNFLGSLCLEAYTSSHYLQRLCTRASVAESALA